jgi:hypothetical protein
MICRSGERLCPLISNRQSKIDNPCHFWLRLGRVVLLMRRFFARRESRSALQGNEEIQRPLQRLRDRDDILEGPK